MRFRLALATAVLFAAAGLASAAPPAPAVVVQVKPVSRLLFEAKEVVRQVGGPAEGERLAKQFEQWLKDGLGEKGFDGLDINRPLLAYVVLKEKPEDCRVVLVAPVTTEKDFVAFLDRIDVKAEPVKDKKGLYALEFQGGPFTRGSHLHVTDAGWAYFTLNDVEPTDAKDLVPIDKLLANADQSLVSVKLYPGRVPAKLVGGWLDELDQGANQLKGFIGAGGDDAKVAVVLLEHGPKLLRQWVEMGLKEVDEVAVAFSFDQQSGDAVAELTVAPKAGTPLAGQIAGLPKTTNRFAGMIPKDAAGGALVQLPLYGKELRAFMGELTEANLAALRNQALPEKLKAVVEELEKGSGRAAKAGKADQAFALLGPNAAGKFTLLMGMSFDDPSALEKAVRALAKDADLGKDFELDAAKVGDVAVHKVPLAKLLPGAEEGLATVFGDKPQGAVAFAKDALFVSFGAGAVDAVKAALEAKPGPAPLLDVGGNMSKLNKLVTAVDPRAGAEFARQFGADDKPFNALRVAVAGGEKLTVKGTLNVRYLPRLVMMFAVGRSAAPPGN